MKLHTRSHKFSAGKTTVRSIIKPATAVKPGTLQLPSWLQVIVRSCFHSLPSPPCSNYTPACTLCISPCAAAVAPSWLQSRTDSQLSQPPNLCCSPTFSPGDTTPERGKQHDCNTSGEEGAILLSHEAKPAGICIQPARGHFLHMLTMATAGKHTGCDLLRRWLCSQIYMGQLAD